MYKISTVLLGLSFVFNQLNFQAGKTACDPVPNYFRNWGLGQVQVREAEQLLTHHSRVKVAVIDTGLDATHPQLSFHGGGYDFVAKTAEVTDSHGHGTHVAGIIAADPSLQRGVSGVSHDVDLIPLKYYEDTASGKVNLANTVKAIDFAVEHGARIINYSGGGPEFSEDEYLAIKRAEEKGILFVAAAGNEHQDTDQIANYYYPSAYRLSNVISVASSDINDNLLPSSNWGKSKVDLVAPGENIFSTLPGAKYGTMSGTSQATAFVSGVAAMLLSQDPTLTHQQLKEALLRSVDARDSLKDKVASGGRLNACGAMKALKSGSKKTQLTKLLE